MWVAHDCGKALNRLTVEGQVQGSVWMGMGQAMSEETAYHDGLMMTANMLDYRVPTIQDLPPIEVGIVESNDPHGPFGAKEAGEGSLAAFLPALTNAIADAIGVRFNDLPVTPDRVFAALEKRRRAAGNGGRTASMRERLMDALPEFQLMRPTTLDDVIAARAAHPDSQLLGGGTDLSSTSGAASSRRRCSSTSTTCAELRAIKADAHAIEIGAAVTLAELAEHPGVVRTIRWWRRRPRSSPGRPIATWARSAATSASTRAASSTTRANGGAPPMTIASRPPARSATSRPRAAACALRPSAATWRRRC